MLFNKFPISTQIVTIQSASLQTLVATPITLINAPGASKALNLISAHWQYLFAAAAYTVPIGYILSIRYAGATSYFQQVSGIGFLDQAVSRTIPLTGDESRQAQTVASNIAIELAGGLGTATELTVGGGSLILTLHYSIITLI